MVLFLAPVAVAQQKKPGGQKSEMQQQIADLKKEISDLEAEIREAEKNDPDEVPDLKKELAMMKRMLAMMDPSAAATTPARPTTVNRPSSSRSPIEPVVLKQVVTKPTEEQARNHLLWYTGKKVNDSTLITVKGLVVQYNKKTGKLKLRPEKSTDPFDKMVSELEKSDQRKDELIDRFSRMKNGPLYYPDLVHALAMYDDLTDRYGPVLKNTIVLPQIDFGNPGRDISYTPTSQRGPNTSYMDLDTVPNDVVKDMIARLNAALKEADEMEKRLPPWDHFPPPPARDPSICSACDTALLARQRKEDSIWHETFSGQESRIMAIRLGVARQIELLGIGEGNFAANLGAFFSGRMGKKINLLNERYGKDIRYAQTVIPVILGWERQKQLLGAPGSSEYVSTLGSALGTNYRKYMEEQMGLKNYNFVLNMAYHLGVARQRALLGAGDDDNMHEFNEALAFDRFALSLDLDFILERKDDDDKLELRATGNLGTEQKVYVQLYLDSCTWRMRLYNPDYSNAKEDELAIPMQVRSGVKTMRDDDKLETFNYSGPKKVMAQFPDFKIDFCNTARQDTAILTSLNYPLADEPPVQTTLKTYKAELLPFANNIFFDLKKLDANADQERDLAGEVMEALSMPKVEQPTGNAKLDKLQSLYNLRKSSDDFKLQVSNLGMNAKSVFLFKAHNGSSVLIDQYNDTKHRIDDNMELTKGLIHLRVVHDPDTVSNLP